MASPLFLTTAAIKRLLPAAELLPLIEHAVGSFSKGPKLGGMVQPVRSRVNTKNDGILLTMPAYSSSDNALATKLVTLFPSNAAKGLPALQSIIMLFDAEEGSIKAIMEGDYVTDVRTACASAVATKYLANPKSKILTILGTGAQARSHYTSMNLVRDFEEIRVYGRSMSKAEAMVQELDDKRVKAFDSVEAACKCSDVICVCVLVTEPLLMKSHVKPGAHINSVGANSPNHSEIDPELMKSGKVYSDSTEACSKESGDVLLSGAEVFCEIGDVVNGTKPALQDETTIFKSMGMAIEDVVAAKLVHDNYEASRTSH